jgi:hypothetical protein
MMYTREVIFLSTEFALDCQSDIGARQIIVSHRNVNSIENMWRVLKQLRRCIEAEWAALSLEDVRKYTDGMKERCQAVIDADGGHTK